MLGWRQRMTLPLNASVEGCYRRLTHLPVSIRDTNARFTTTLDSGPWQASLRWQYGSGRPTLRRDDQLP